jgi:hypothetical protein
MRVNAVRARAGFSGARPRDENQTNLLAEARGRASWPLASPPGPPWPFLAPCPPPPLAPSAAGDEPKRICYSRRLARVSARVPVDDARYSTPRSLRPTRTRGGRAARFRGAARARTRASRAETPTPPSPTPSLPLVNRPCPCVLGGRWWRACVTASIPVERRVRRRTPSHTPRRGGAPAAPPALPAHGPRSPAPPPPRAWPRWSPSRRPRPPTRGAVRSPRATRCAAMQRKGGGGLRGRRAGAWHRPRRAGAPRAGPRPRLRPPRARPGPCLAAGVAREARVGARPFARARRPPVAGRPSAVPPAAARRPRAARRWLL